MFGWEVRPERVGHDQSGFFNSMAARANAVGASCRCSEEPTKRGSVFEAAEILSADSPDRQGCLVLYGRTVALTPGVRLFSLAPDKRSYRNNLIVEPSTFVRERRKF